MRKITNKEYKLKTTLLEQDSQIGELRVIKVSQSITLFQLLEPLIRSNQNQQGFDPHDLKQLQDRIEALNVMEGVKPNIEIEVENSVFETILKAGKDFRPGFADIEMLNLKKYFIDLEKEHEELKDKELNKNKK